MAFCWWVDDGPLIVVFVWILSPLGEKKNFKVGPPLTKLSGSAHDKYRLKILVVISVSTIQHNGNRKKVLLGCFPPIDQANPFACSCSFILHTSYKNGMPGQRVWGRRLSNCSKTNYYKSSIVTNFGQTCS